MGNIPLVQPDVSWRRRNSKSECFENENSDESDIMSKIPCYIYYRIMSISNSKKC